jgi:hypothetical protein
LLGFGSDFKVRQLEKAGQLRPVRGAMGQAWYPRAQVLALRAGGLDLGRAASEQVPAGRVGVRVTNQGAKGRWSDAELIAHLRGNSAAAGPDGSLASGLTVVDLVAETGVSIARAEKVYRFWLANDRHPVARSVRETARHRTPARPSSAEPVDGYPSRSTDVATAPSASRPPHADLGGKGIGERRAAPRLEREVLIRRLRDPDPAVRADAFHRLKQLQGQGKDPNRG